MLYEFITLNRDEIIRRCRAKVAARSVPPPTEAEIENGVPLFLEQLVDALRAGESKSAAMSASAVTQFGAEHHQSTIDGETVRENERLGFFAHELRNLIHTALVAFEVVKSGNVGVGGSTGAVLHRSLVKAQDLVAHSLAEVRLSRTASSIGSPFSWPDSSTNWR